MTYAEAHGEDHGSFLKEDPKFQHVFSGKAYGPCSRSRKHPTHPVTAGSRWERQRGITKSISRSVGSHIWE